MNGDDLAQALRHLPNGMSVCSYYMKIQAYFMQVTEEAYSLP